MKLYKHSGFNRALNAPMTAIQKVARRLTNWQNSQWLRDGAKEARIEHFAGLERSR